jgi:hypothetical protein
MMRKFMLATTSTLALSLATMGLGYAQVSGDANAPTSPTAPAPPSNMPATPGAQTPGGQGAQPYQGAQGAMNTQGTQAKQGTQGAMNTQGMQPDQNTQAATNAVTPDRSQLKQAQQQLRSAGLYKGRIDGQMGPRTRQAVIAFQQQHNLSTTGRLDQQTMAALQSGG